uniref:Uncharacterized protein n=1 Tax=Anopheles farauti TaxID=69004 RepID=A0A182Q2K9_9DIPT
MLEYEDNINIKKRKDYLLVSRRNVRRSWSSPSLDVTNSSTPASCSWDEGSSNVNASFQIGLRDQQLGRGVGGLSNGDQITPKFAAGQVQRVEQEPNFANDLIVRETIVIQELAGEKVEKK